ncbi:MAG: hypothetical protein K9K88_06340 [Desulfobacterales bacterium]|nr:hypothetical protein [Desulfobacterales bacterium]
MKLGERIQLRIKEASVYQAHGLFAEATQHYQKTLAMLEPLPDTPAKRKLTSYIEEQLRKIQAGAVGVSALEKSPQLSDRQQKVVQRTVGSDKDRNSGEADFQVAATLMGFGQFNKALAGFHALLKTSVFGVRAAKNILRCLIAVGSIAMAARQYHQWLENEEIPEEDLNDVRIFLEGILRRKESDETLARPSARRLTEQTPSNDSDPFDIMAVMLPVESGDGKDDPPAFDVTSQSGGFVSLIVPAAEKSVVARLKPGARIRKVGFFTPEALFFEDCVVSTRLRIDEGRRKGDFSVTVRLSGTNYPGYFMKYPG